MASKKKVAVSHINSVETGNVEKDNIENMIKLDSQNVLMVGDTALYTMGVADKFKRMQKIYCYEGNFKVIKYMS
jgi:hypothetical protein